MCQLEVALSRWPSIRLSVNCQSRLARLYSRCCKSNTRKVWSGWWTGLGWEPSCYYNGRQYWCDSWTCLWYCRAVHPTRMYNSVLSLEKNISSSPTWDDHQRWRIESGLAHGLLSFMDCDSSYIIEVFFPTRVSRTDTTWVLPIILSRKINEWQQPSTNMNSIKTAYWRN